MEYSKPKLQAWAGLGRPFFVPPIFAAPPMSAHPHTLLSPWRSGQASSSPTFNSRKLDFNFQLPTSGSWISTSDFQLPTSRFQLPAVGGWKLKTAHLFLEVALRQKVLFAPRPTPACGCATKQRETSHLPSRRPMGGTFAAFLPPPTPVSRGRPMFSCTLRGEILLQWCTLIQYDS